MNWEEITKKIASMFDEKVEQIRKNFNEDFANRIIQITTESLVSSGFELKESGPVDIDMTMLSELFDKINGEISFEISNFANSIGSIVEEESPNFFSADRFAGEDKDNVYFRHKKFLIRIEKNQAIKYVTLGGFP